MSELHFDKVPDPVDFQRWKVNFKTEVCSYSGCPTIAMLWTKEVEIAISVDDLMTSQSVEGLQDFSDLEMLDVKIPSALRKIIIKFYYTEMTFKIPTQNVTKPIGSKRNTCGQCLGKESKAVEKNRPILRTWFGPKLLAFAGFWDGSCERGVYGFKSSRRLWDGTSTWQEFP